MPKRTFVSVFLLFAAFFPTRALAQKAEESWLRALSVETGVVSTGLAPSAILFAARAELHKPRIGGSALRIELCGWRSDRREGGASIAHWAQHLALGVAREFQHGTGIGALTPSL